jgi:hypothetical protein
MLGTTGANDSMRVRTHLNNGRGNKPEVMD